jgi:hypothetical protein
MSVAIIAVVLFAASAVGSRLSLEFAAASEAPLHRMCGDWEPGASEAVGVLVRDPSDATARQASDALFRLRRARRNCRAGWIGLACQDYQAIIHPADYHARANLCSPEMLAISAELAAR